jgi:hypothetical protein
VKLRIPKEVPPPPPGGLVTEAELRPSEIQDLADEMGEIMSLVAGKEIKFVVRIELEA